MGGYGLYVWGSYGMAALVLVFNVLAARRREKNVRRELEESHRGALAALADLPEEKLGLELDGGIFLELYAVDTYDHFREHIAQVLSWRKRLENV